MPQKNNIPSLNYRIVEQSWIARIAAWKLSAARVAIVLGSRIYLCNVTKAEFLQNEAWLRHELCHVAQFKRYGFLPFIARYLWQSLRHGYYKNKYEVEARAAEEIC